PDELAALYRKIESRLLTAWDAPLINDFLAMIFYGLLRQLCTNWCADANGSIRHDLLANEGGMISAQPALRMKDMAAMLRSNPSLRECLRDLSREAIEQSIDSSPQLKYAVRVYIDQFGDRCQDELKLESPTLFDDPLPLYRAIGQLASAPEPEPERSNDARTSAEQ
ncbi:MAG TPA: hypothetical protein VG498_07275, partial [Terriglobales bacterium]|nr:hypothetical protein [Terriglobales bacterium]